MRWPAIIAWAALAAPAPDRGAIYGKYSNCSYGYTATLPAGVVAFGSVAPDPDHGFGIDLSKPSSPEMWGGWPERYLSVDASYDALESKTASGAIQAELVELRRDHPHLRVKLKRVRMGRAAGMLATVSFDKRVEERAIAYRSDGVVFTVALHTTAATRNSDQAIFDQILHGLDSSPTDLDCSSDED